MKLEEDKEEEEEEEKYAPINYYEMEDKGKTQRNNRQQRLGKNSSISVDGREKKK